MSSTSFAPATATRVTTDGGFVVSSTFVLEPQTTPFVQPSSCSNPRIYCDEGYMTPSGACVAIDSMAEDDFDLLTSDCYPPEYTNIYLYKGESADLTTAAFPGTACISGWTTACSGTVVGDGDAKYPQTYCCPPGGYTCDTNWGQRQCVSFLSTATDIWVTNTTGTYGFQTTQFAGFGDDEEPIWVWRRAFPISGVDASATAATITATASASASGGIGAAAEGSSGSGADSATSSEGERAPLSTGRLAGVVIGAAACLAFLVAAGFWLFKRRKAQEPAYEPTASAASLSGFQSPQSPPTEHAGTAYGGGYIYPKAELSVHQSEVAELPASYGPGYIPDPAEVEGQNSYPPDSNRSRHEMP